MVTGAVDISYLASRAKRHSESVLPEIIICQSIMSMARWMKSYVVAVASAGWCGCPINGRGF